MHANANDDSAIDLVRLASDIKNWGRALGFDAVGIADADLSDAEPRLLAWLTRGWHGEMNYMARHASARCHPEELLPGTVSVISGRMNYVPRGARDSGEVLERGELAFFSRYALGRDYHKVLRGRLQKLAERIAREAGAFRYRVLVDSAPAMDVELARKAGLGWRGKHTLLLDRGAGSLFFLGEIYTDLPLPPDPPLEEHCGTCEKCISVCPTGAIVAPYLLDARRCISYLTIEAKGSIPENLRPLLGDRIYGCDDCLTACPWNRFARISHEAAFEARHSTTGMNLIEYLDLTENQFRTLFRRSPIKRIKRRGFLRNVCVALGNVGTTEDLPALNKALRDPEPLIAEHAQWAIDQIQLRMAEQSQ